VLDASALLALLNGESGSERMVEVLPDTAIARFLEKRSRHWIIREFIGALFLNGFL
jgi:predicted nucleic acid-binding protein